MVKPADGWEYEGPDHSVGIFGEAYYHTACELWHPDDDDWDKFEAQSEVINVTTIRVDGGKRTIYLNEVVCPACKASFEYTDEDWDYEEEEAQT